jgi:hypothetical protein
MASPGVDVPPAAPGQFEKVHGRTDERNHRRRLHQGTETVSRWVDGYVRDGVRYL